MTTMNQELYEAVRAAWSFFDTWHVDCFGDAMADEYEALVAKLQALTDKYAEEAA